MEQDYVSQYVGKEIERVCDRFHIEQSVRKEALLMCDRMSRNAIFADQKTSEVAAGILSIAHEKALRMGRVPRHLPDRMIADVLDIDATKIVFARRLANRLISGAKKTST
jgi:transcription initiation factor TFIIIB Brf1 subunit/transcription initiation factor TFIIB